MNFEPLVSVIVPVYKVEKYIDDCIRCVIRQTYPNYELILVDDGSPDNSGEICDSYAEQYGWITVLHQKNQGQAAARNHALQIAKGEYVSFLDSDDLLHPQALEIFVHSIAETGACAAFGGYIAAETVPDNFYDGVTATPVVYEINEEKLTDLFCNSRRYWCVCCGIMKTEILKQYPFPEGHFYEDNAIMPRWLYEHGKIAEVDVPLYFYRTNPGSTTQSGLSVRYGDYVWALEQQMNFLKEIGYENLYLTVCNLYFRTATEYYYFLSKKAKEKKAASVLQNRMHCIYGENREALQWDKHRRLEICSVWNYGLRWIRYERKLRYRMKMRFATNSRKE